MLNRQTHELVNIPMKKPFVALLAQSIERLGYGNRSDFIRDAIVEKLQRAGVVVPLEFAAATPRGRRHYEIEPAENAALNDAPLPGGVSSDVARDVVAGADAVAAMVAPSAESAPLPKAAATTYKKRGQPARTAPRRNSPRSVPGPVPTLPGNPT